MNICEATKMALKGSGLITRENEFWKERIEIEPTNSPDCCVLHGTDRNPRRGWQPNAEDLTAEDWIVLQDFDGGMI